MSVKSRADFILQTFASTAKDFTSSFKPEDGKMLRLRKCRVTFDPDGSQYRIVIEIDRNQTPEEALFFREAAQKIRPNVVFSYKGREFRVTRINHRARRYPIEAVQVVRVKKSYGWERTDFPHRRSKFSVKAVVDGMAP